MNMIRMYSRPAGRHMLNNVFSEMMNTSDCNGRHMPAANILDTEKAFEIALQVPGINKDDLRISLEKDVISISYEAPEMQGEVQYTRQEFASSSFCRSFMLPDSVDREKINARHENGILHLELPRKESEVKLQREIAIA